MLPSLIAYQSQNVDYFTSYSPPQLQIILFFFSLYLVAVGQGGHKPCTQAFGANQFDGQNLEECKSKRSFFNWWLFGVSTGTSVTYLIVSYIEDNFNWGLGFGIPYIVMVAALLVFLLGTRTYWFTIKGNGESPFVRIGKVFVEARPWPLGSCYNKSCFQFVGDFQRMRLDSSWFVQLLKRVSLVYTRHALLLEELTVRLICLKMHRKLFLVKNVLKMSILIFGNCFECFLT